MFNFPLWHNRAPMDSSLTALLAFLAERHAAGRPLALATIVATTGSTYRKPGARMLIDADGTACGLLSGGCLESDLLERCRAVIATGAAQLVEYDLRASDDPIWGLGLGCEGAMTILLQRLTAADDYRPLNRVRSALELRTPTWFGTIVRSTVVAWPVGACVFEGEDNEDVIGRALNQAIVSCNDNGPAAQLVEVGRRDEQISVFLGRIDLPPEILLLGAGPDAVPVARAAEELGWSVTVYDHRPAYAVKEHFPQANQVLSAPADELGSRVDLSRYDAAVVMSHHLQADLHYLRHLADAPVRYIGLLGPRERRQRLFADLGALGPKLAGRLHGPVGLDIGARTPEAIALAIVAEIHAVLAGRTGQSFSRVQKEYGP
jgi:xanthine/CO dehydrogenase XdhC/CoxF family maturation factor